MKMGMEVVEMRNMIEEIVIIGGLIGVQLVYAGNAVLMSFIMSFGLTSLTIAIYTSFATFAILFPFAFYFERAKWPRQISLKFLIQIMLLSFGGVTLFQPLFLKGISLTSPAMGTAMPNIAPGLIFVISWTFRLEKVKLSCTYSRVKIIGTLMCIVGAFAMSIMQCVSDQPNTQAHGPPFEPILLDNSKIIGCLYLVAAVFVLSTIIVLQAFILGDFPAPMSLSAITSLFGALIGVIAQFLEHHSFDTATPSLLSFRDLLAFSFLGGIVSAATLSFNMWAIKKRGPVLVSMFSPVGTVCSVIFSVLTKGYSLNFGSVGGMLLMFTGLYFVLWAKGKEGYNINNNADGHASQSECDAHKPLLC